MLLRKLSVNTWMPLHMITRGIANSKSNPPICDRKKIWIRTQTRLPLLTAWKAYFLELRNNQRIGKAYSATKAGDSGKTPPIRQRTCAFQIHNPDYWTSSSNRTLSLSVESRSYLRFDRAVFILTIGTGTFPILDSIFWSLHYLTSFRRLTFELLHYVTYPAGRASPPFLYQVIHTFL